MVAQLCGDRAVVAAYAAAAADSDVSSHRQQLSFLDMRGSAGVQLT